MSQRGNGGSDGGAREGNARLAIWVTFAGTILAALIGGAFALVAANGGGRSDASPPGTRPATGAVTTTAAQPAQTTGAPVAGGVRWSGSRTLQDTINPDYVDLDANPPESVDSGSIGDIEVASTSDEDRPGADLRNDSLAHKARIAVWSGAGAPTFEQCREAALGGVNEARAVRVGTVLCVKTTEGRVAMLTTKAIDTRQHSVTFDVTVWG